jgi:preprotein translocase subunit SecG
MPGWMKWAVALVAGFGFITLGWRLLDSRWFSWLLPTFFVVNCLFLIIVVLLQSGKAADIAGAFGGAGSQTAFGPRGAATVLSRATTWCAIMFMVCAFALLLHTEKSAEQGGSVLEKFSKPAPKPGPVTPAKPQTAIPLSSTPQSSAPTNTAPAPSTQPPVQQQAPSNSQTAPSQQPKKP